MGLLDNFEQRLDQLVNGTFAKAFRDNVEPVELAATDGALDVAEAPVVAFEQRVQMLPEDVGETVGGMERQLLDYLAVVD